MKWYAITLLIGLLVLQYKFWFEEGGYLHNHQLKKQLEVARIENEQLKQRNRQLAREIILVKEDDHEIEALARKNLGMIKADEQFVFLMEDSASKKLTSQGHQANSAKEQQKMEKAITTNKMTEIQSQ